MEFIIHDLVTFKNSSEKITLSEACEFYKRGLAVSVSDGKDITFILEEKKKCS